MSLSLPHIHSLEIVKKHELVFQCFGNVKTTNFKANTGIFTKFK